MRVCSTYRLVAPQNEPYEIRLETRVEYLNGNRETLQDVLVARSHNYEAIHNLYFTLTELLDAHLARVSE